MSKVMDFGFLLKIWTKILLKIYVKTWLVNTATNFLLNNAKQSDALKLLQKKVIQKTSEATCDLISYKITHKWQKSQELHHRKV